MRTRILSALLALCAACTPQSLTLSPPEIGSLVGEVFVADPERRSVSGAIVEVYGTSARAVSEEGKRFVLGNVPIGEHLVTIEHPESGRVTRFAVSFTQAYQTLQLSEAQTTLGRAATLRGVVTGPGAARAGLAGVTVYLVGGNNRQVTISGGDGGFVLEGLPSGGAEIGFAYPGYDAVTVSLDLVEGDNAAPPARVGATSGAIATIRGTVKLTDKSEHDGTVVTLDRGTSVVTTDGSGNFELADVPTGVHSVRAERQGYRSTELPLVTVDGSGTVRGLSRMYLSPGSDAQTSDANVDFSVAIASPLSNDRFELGQAVTLVANVTHSLQVITGSRVRWSVAPVDGGASTSLGSGNPLTLTSLPLGMHILTAQVTDNDGRVRQAQSVVEIVPVSVQVTIQSHAPNALVLADLPTVFAAEVVVRQGVTVPAEAVVWSFRQNGTTDVPTPLGSGATLVAKLPSFAAETIVDLMCDVQVGGGTGSALVTVTLKPLRPDTIVPQAFSAYVPPPVPTLVTDPTSGAVVRVDYSIAASQPALLRATTDSSIAASVTWTSTSGVAFSGADADLSVLAVGTHDFTVTVPGAQGQNGTSLVRVVVQPFSFSLTTAEPLLSPPQPYFHSNGLPYNVQIVHAFQTAFTPTSIKWFAASGAQVGIGKQGRTFQLPPGPGVLRAEVTDAVGNVASALAPYTLQQVTFTASIVQPTVPASYLEGAPVQMVIAYAHSLVPSQIAESALSVRYFSSIEGLLSEASVNEFSVSDQPVFTGLVPGVHTITAQIFDGTGYAQATVPVTIRSPGVSATLSAPVSERVFFPSDALSFTASAVADNAAVVQRSWYVDGVEFDSSWDDYGSAGPTGPARDTINLGTYPSAAPFTQLGSPWTEGTHTVRFFARLPSVDPLLGCVNIPNQAVCLTVVVNLGPAVGADLCTPGSTTLITTPVVWSGVKRLDCLIRVQTGGSLTVQQGARIVIGTTGTRRIEVQGGTLSIGSPGQSNPVLFTSQTTSKTAWSGIYLTAAAGTAATVELHNVKIRNANGGIEVNNTFGAAEHSFSAERVTFEYNTFGIRNYCPPSGVDLTFVDTTTGIEEYYGCDVPRVYDGLVFERVETGINVRQGALTVRNSTFSAIGGNGIVAAGESASIVVEDSVFDQGPDFDPNNFAIQIADLQCQDLRVVRSVFRGFSTGIAHRFCNAPLLVPRLTVLGNVFDKNSIAIEDSSGSLTPAEIHLNSFLTSTAGTDLRVLGKSVDVEAQGNYLGPVNDSTTAAGAQLGVAPGIISNLPRISDNFDDVAVDRVARVDNVLETSFSSPALHPAAYIREPQRTRAYNSNRCVPLVYDAPLGGVGACRWFITPPSGVEAAATVDADGCATSVLGDGEHLARLECDVIDSMSNVVRVDQHRTRFLVKNDSYSGTQRRPIEHWSGTVLVDGDVIIPAGKTLVIDPGTTVRFATADRLRHAISLDYSDPINDFWGSRDLVDIYVRGTLLANGTVGMRTRLESTSGLPLASQWGNINLDHSATFQLSYADIKGANYLAHGRYDVTQQISAPVVTMSNLSLDGVRVVARGVCPQTFNTIVGEDITRNVVEAFCPAAFTVQNSSFLRVGDPSGSFDAFWLNSYGSTAAPIAVGFVNMTLDRGFATRTGDGIVLPSLSSIDAVSISGSTLKNFNHMITYPGGAESEALLINDSVFDNFNYLSVSTGEIDLCQVDRSRFANGQFLFYSSEVPNNLQITRSAVSAVTTPFSNMQLGVSPVVLSVTGSQFAGYTRVFQFGVAGSGTLTANLSGNNYLGNIVTKASILDLNENGLLGCPSSPTTYCSTAGTITAQVDMTGSHFGTNAGGGAPKTDDEIKIALGWEGSPPFASPAVPAGRQVDHSGSSSTPLVLDLLP